MAKYALFTCDTELTPPWNTGTWEDMDPWTFEPGVAEIEKVLDKHNIRGTFYCQGTVAEKFPDIVRILSMKHLIGSHGYNHENYGGRPVTVWTKTNPVFAGDYNEKKELIAKSKAAIKNVIGQDPSVFVAPFDWTDPDLVTILDELGFEIDSSYHNYSLGLPSAFFSPIGRRILELPLSVTWCGDMRYKNILEAFTYDQNYASQLLEQSVLFLTCHPWEFTDINVPHPRKTLIVGSEKIIALDALISLLKGNGYLFVDPLQLRKEVLS